MYSHCLFCNADLGRNEALEAFPVGRRLAYDAEKGRLWVVCGGCRRWNLTPLEERWEAIEQAERLSRGTRLRASTDHVGLARVADGVDLVRVGRPLLPEFAAWRYGWQLNARRRRYVLRATPAGIVGTVGGAVTLGAYVAGLHVLLPALTGGAGFLGTAAAWFGAGKLVDVVGAATDRAHRATKAATVGSAATITARVRVQIDAPTSDPLVVRRGHLAETALDAGSDGALVLDLRHDAGRAEFRGAEARRVAALIAPTLNPAGAGEIVLREAIRSISVRGGPERYLATISRWTGKATRPMPAPPTHWTPEARLPDDAGLYALSNVQRLALEVALHEDAERRALDGELAGLERAWRDAEEIAGIADGLALPRSVDDAWQRLRASRDA